MHVDCRLSTMKNRIGCRKTQLKHTYGKLGKSKCARCMTNNSDKTEHICLYSLGLWLTILCVFSLCFRIDTLNVSISFCILSNIYFLRALRRYACMSIKFGWLRVPTHKNIFTTHKFESNRKKILFS